MRYVGHFGWPEIMCAAYLCIFWFIDDAAKRDENGNLHAVTANSNLNFRYSLSAFYSIGDGTEVTVQADTEYKVELLYGIENYSPRTPVTNPNFLQNWGVQSVAYSFYKN